MAHNRHADAPEGPQRIQSGHGIEPAEPDVKKQRGRPQKATNGAAKHQAGLLRLRIDFGRQGMIGPGKIALLEAISKTGSIRAAGQEFGMSYRRAWQLVDETNRTFSVPLVHKKVGGADGGGARLTTFGEDVIARFRAIEATCAEASGAQLAFLKANLAKTPRT